MKTFDVYTLSDITPVKAKGCYLWDEMNNKYLDMYGGHAVISVGHSHPYYIKKLSNQLESIGFYSNSVHNSTQNQLAENLGRISGYQDYHLFLCNSGAEANENALKIASFHNKKKKIISFSNAFHGRTSMAVAATDNKKIIAPINETDNIIFLPLNDEQALEQTFKEQDISSVIIEAIQGVGGVIFPKQSFLKKIETLCKENNAIFIMDEIQSGYGRTGKFFAHQFHEIKPEIITIAKGMGNGFPVAGVLIHPKIKAIKGMLGTTFGGNYLACAASLAVLEIIQNEDLLKNAKEMGAFLTQELLQFKHIREVRSQGLMIGIELYVEPGNLRSKLLKNHQILTGASSDKNTFRITPPLTITKKEINQFIKALKTEWQN